jgi:hypothetical protein
VWLRLRAERGGLGEYGIAYWPRVNECQVGRTVGCLKSTGGELPTALSIKLRQIVAGKLGPETAIPCTFVIGISARG